MSNSTNNAEQIAATILTQLGGRKFKVMTGAKNFMYSGITEHNDKYWLRMDLPRNASKCNRLKVYYNEGLDTYTMEFYKQTISRKTFDVKLATFKLSKMYTVTCCKVYLQMLQGCIQAFKKTIH